MATPNQIYTNTRAQAIDPDGDFIADSELRVYLQQAGNIIYRKLGIGQDKDTSITTVSGTEEYTIVASDSAESVSVINEVIWNAVRLKRINRRELAGEKGLSYGGTDTTGNPIYYWKYDNKIGLYPVPDSAQTLEIRYNSSFTSDITLAASDTSTTILSQLTEDMQWNCIHYMLWRIYLKDQDDRAIVEKQIWDEFLQDAQTEWFNINHGDENMAAQEEESFSMTDRGAV